MQQSVVVRAAKRFRQEGIPGVKTALAARLRPDLFNQPDPPVTSPMPGVFEWLAASEAPVVMQIGAFVGDSFNDPVYGFLSTILPDKPDARAVLVEPVTDYFEKLAASYSGVPRVALENVAIADTTGPREFHRLGVDPADYGMPEFLSQLGSLKAERMTDLWDGFEGQTMKDEWRAFWLEHQVTETVECSTVRDLVAKHGLDRVDLLVMDVEGFEYEILKTMDFEALRPLFISFERALLQENEPACRALLRDAGYVLIDWDIDTLAIDIRSSAGARRAGS